MGGKSRKSGGVSKKLIQALKAGNYSNKPKCGSNKTVSNEKGKTRIRTVFDFDEELPNNS